MDRDFVAEIPFNKLLGIRFSSEHEDGITLECPVKPELLNSKGVLHGGVAASIADVAVGVAILHQMKRERPISTVDMKINYFRPVAEGTLYARARLLRVGSTLSIGSVDLTDSDSNLVGVATVTYIFLDAKGKP
ncbi:MAG TPA: PaaI family thioesterase [Bryobacteraceae bacterium]|nr:PaaI family thioesterase [Bryobacteraceae bacterium]